LTRFRGFGKKVSFPDKAKPSVRVGRKATGLRIPGVEPASGYFPSWLVFWLGR